MSTPRPKALAVAILSISVAASAQTDALKQARALLDACGVKGGVVVHLGCGDGQLTAALGQAAPLVVHGLDPDRANVRKAREHVRSLGLYGRVSVDRLRGPQLPYADDLVNLLVVSDDCGVRKEEMLRVLTPRGVLLPANPKSEIRDPKSVKPVPDGIDDWSHFLHDASGNAVAHDDVVGPPARLQWTTGPAHTRSHEHTPSINAMVSAGGRLFYIADQAPIADIRVAPEWQLLSRDAFNGTLLWQRPLEGAWFPKIINWGQTPPYIHRRMVATGSRVFATLGYHAPVTAMDAETGQTIHTYKGTEGTEEMVLHDGVLLLLARRVTPERTAEMDGFAELARKEKSILHKREAAEKRVKQFKTAENKVGRFLVALDVETDSVLWRKTSAEIGWVRPFSLCAEGQRAFFFGGGKVSCVKLRTGEPLWSAASPPLWLVNDGRLVCVGNNRVALLSADTGKVRWSDEASLIGIRDVFVANGALWIGGFKAFQGRTTGKRGPAWGPHFATERDLETGKILKRVEPDNPGHHHRCYQNKATDRYIFGGRRGTELIDLDSGDVLWNSWARGVCRYGVMPCNGLLYAPPHACACYSSVKLTGFNALAPAGPLPSPVDDPGTLERGPAYGTSPDPRPETRNPQSATRNPQSRWFTYRGDASRSGSTTSRVPANLSPAWQVDVGDALTAPTVARGKVFVASPDAHLVHAVDAVTGRIAWSFTAAARADSPPTLHDGKAVFGCRDGSVYSVHASDGALAWRVRAARGDRLIAAQDQLESVWPVNGSVLLDGDTLCVAAGRSSYMDGGIDLCRIEPDTGKIVSRKTVYTPDPETGRQPKHTSPSTVPGVRADILVADESHIYIRDMTFDKDGAPRKTGKPHLFTMTDFLDASWPHRSYWMYGTKLSVSMGCGRREKGLIYGRLLVFDDSTIYGYGRKDVHWSSHLQDGAYRLFAVKRGDGAARWSKTVPIQVRAMVLAGDVLFAASPPVAAVTGPTLPGSPPTATLMAVSAKDGSVLARHHLDVSPVFDGMAAAGGRLYISLSNGQLLCMAGEEAR